MDNNMMIQIYSPDYKEQVIDLILNIQCREFQINISLEDQPDLNNIPGFYQISAGNFWVATVNGEVIGTIALIDIGDGQGVIRKMFVKPTFRGTSSGTARMLLESLLNWSVEQGFQALFLGTTEKFKAAHRFYEKNGFKQVSKTELPSTFPIMKVDSRFYKIELC